MFSETPERIPFGWIWHGSYADLTANSTCWEGDRLTDGRERGKWKGRTVLEAGSENSLSVTNTQKSDLLPRKGKKLLVEGRPVSLLT